MCFKKTSDEGGRQKGIVCFNCKEPGHPARWCPNNRALLGHESEVKGNMGLYCKGLVEGRMVNQILLDTGCSRTMVRRQLVPHTKMLEGKMVSIKCAHGDTVLYPLAVVDMEVEGIPVHVHVGAAVVDTLPVEVLLGTDMSELPQLLGKRASYSFFSQEDELEIPSWWGCESEKIVRMAEELDSKQRAVLTQVGGDGQEHPVGYFSRKLLPREQQYSTI